MSTVRYKVVAVFLGMTLLQSVFIAGAAEKTYVATDKDTVAAYNPAQQYSGQYIQTRLYYRNPRSDIWRRMSLSDQFRDHVRCQVALQALESTGTWQGHLRGDGSCGPLDEPSIFAVGNRINFDELLPNNASR